MDQYSNIVDVDPFMDYGNNEEFIVLVMIELEKIYKNWDS